MEKEKEIVKPDYLVSADMWWDYVVEEFFDGVLPEDGFVIPNSLLMKNSGAVFVDANVPHQTVKKSILSIKREFMEEGVHFLSKAPVNNNRISTVAHYNYAGWRILFEELGKKKNYRFNLPPEIPK